MCKAYSELNDPIDQLNRFKEQQAMRDAGDDEAMMMDIDYVEALEYAMPPACGFGFSERVFWSLEGVTAREGVIFPQLRRETTEPSVKAAPKASTHAKDLPVSAAEQGTRKLYLDDYEMLECDAKIVAIDDLGEGKYRFELDQTCAYPRGGGQDCDLGRLEWPDGKLEISEITKDASGAVYHDGSLEGVIANIGDTVRVVVAKDRRFANSRMHCAGHLIDYAIAKLGKDWKAGKGSHMTGRCYVEYEGEFNADEAEELARNIERVLAEVATKGGAITPSSVPSSEAHVYSAYLPQKVLDSYQNVHVTKYPDNFNVCCGGTHLSDTSELGEVKIEKIKKKNGNIRVSYEIL